MRSLRDQAIRHLQEKGATDLTDIAKALGIGEETTAFLLAHLVQHGKARLPAESVKGKE